MNIDEFLKLVHQRSSCREYLEREVPDDMIRNCLEAARCAPSACNKQPWRFVIVKDAELRRFICENALLPGIPMPWMKCVPVIVVLCAERQFVTHQVAPLISGVNYDLLDIGIAGEHFVLAAEAQGLGTCWIGWFRAKPLHRELKIPRSVKILSLISLGFPEFPVEVNEKQKKSVNEIAFADYWNKV